MSSLRASLKKRFPRATTNLADFVRWHLRPRHDFGTEMRYSYGLPLVELHSEAQVLEVGRCTHRTLTTARRVKDVTTCDLGETGRSLAHHGPRNLRQIQSDICTLDLDDASFDVILAMAVLEHIAEDAQAVRNIFRLLKPGGRFVGYVPDTAEHLAAWKSGKYPDHVRPGYTVEEMRSLLASGGFDVQHCQLDHGAYAAVAGDLYYRILRRLRFFARLPHFFVKPFVALARRDDRRDGSLEWGLFFKAVKPGDSG